MRVGLVGLVGASGDPVGMTTVGRVGGRLGKALNTLVLMPLRVVKSLSLKQQILGPTSK